MTPRVHVPSLASRSGSGLLFVLIAIALLSLGLTACGDDDGGNSSGVGNVCSEDDDCETGTCYLGPGGGYCTSPCSGEGTVDACPEDTVCKPIQGGPERCLLVCGSESACNDGNCPDDFCPDGSSCVDIADTDLRACEPDPN